MSNEFVSSDRMTDSNSSHDHCYDQPLIGQDFASTIVVADLAIRSSTFIPTKPSPSPREAKKVKRRVTFNLDDIQIQTIPTYYSSSSVASSSSDEEMTSERISKKESYSQLQERMQTRREHTVKPGYWYPSRSLNGTMMIRQQPLPSLRSIEMTEQLIAESIQREMASNPHLLQQAPSHVYSSSFVLEDHDGDDEEEEYTPLQYIDDDDDDDDDIPFPDYIPSRLSVSSSAQKEDVEPTEPESVCIAYQDAPTDQLPMKQYFFIKVLRVENLDFPIEKDTTGVYCTIRYKDHISTSTEQRLQHNLQFNHDMRIDPIDMQAQIAITLHATKKTIGSHWYHKMKSGSDLNRYIHEKDSSLCQTLLPLSQFIPSDKTVALLLTNNWYRPQTESSLFQLIKKKPVAKEKGVGKIILQCLTIDIRSDADYVPHDMDEAMEALNAKRFYQTQWQSGYMMVITQSGLNNKHMYFTLTGGSLVAHATQDSLPAYQIPLARAIKLLCDGRVISERPLYQYPMQKPATIISELESVILSSEEEEDRPRRPISLTNRFELLFDNEETIQFECDSIDDLTKWVTLITVIMSKLPKLPDWIQA